MVPSKAASLTVINRIRAAVAELPSGYSATGEWAVDKDLREKHRLLCKIEALLTVLNAKEKRSHQNANLQRQADRIQQEVITQQQQPQKNTNRSTAVTTEARERPREWRPPVVDCGPVSPGDWLEVLDFQPPLASDPHSRSILMFEVWLGWIPMIITTCTSCCELSVKPGDWLWVAEVTFDCKGRPSIFDLASTSQDSELEFQAQFLEAKVPAPPPAAAQPTPRARPRQPAPEQPPPPIG